MESIQQAIKYAVAAEDDFDSVDDFVGEGAEQGGASFLD
jgi:hypothetical protein